MSAKRADELIKIRETLLMSPIIGIPENIGGTPLMYAAYVGNIEVIKLLIEKGADVNARNNHNGTALMLVAQRGDLVSVRLLLEKGADARVRHASGYTALMYAAASENSDPELIRAFLARGVELNVKANDGETALKLAGRKGRTEIVRLLEKAGAKE